jgi:predicted dehydrogenase
MTEAVTPLRIGLVGYGKGGRYFHAPLIEGAGCLVAGVMTRDPGRASEAVTNHTAAVVVGSIDELAALGVDALTISTPVGSREALVRQGLEHRLPMVCDKPFAPSGTQARALFAAAQAAGVPITVYQNRRLDSDFLTVVGVVASGELGEVVRVESAMEQLTPPEGVAVSGGGMLADLGVHQVDQALQLLGPATSVHATVHARADLGGLEDQFTMVIRHASGSTSHLMGSQAAHGEPVARFRVVGMEGSYWAPPCDAQADALLAGQTPATLGAEWGAVPQTHWGRVYHRGRDRVVPARRGDWCDFYRAFARAVRDGAAMPVTPAQAIAVIDVIDAARISAAEDRVVHLGPTDGGT